MPCNKIGYETNGAALTDAKHIKARTQHFSKQRGHKKSNMKLTPYPCPLCGKYHLTTLKQNIKQNRSKRR